MTEKKDAVKKDLHICAVLALLVMLLAAVPVGVPTLFVDFRVRAAFAAVQLALVLPLAYYARPVLRRGRRSLFGGIPAMEGLAFAACITGLAAGLIGSVSAVTGHVSLTGLVFAPLAATLVTVLAAEYFKSFGTLPGADSEGVSAGKTAAFVLPLVFAAALAAALSWWFYGLGAAAAWLVLAGVLLAGSAGAFMLAGVLPLHFAAQNAKNNGYAFADAASAENCRRITMAVFDDSFAPAEGQEITDIITAAISEAQLLALAAGVTAAAAHPLQNVFKTASAGLPVPACSGVVKLRGGITAQCSKHNVRMGTLAFVRSVAVIGTEYAKYEAQLQKQGKTVFYITSGRALQGIIAVGPKVSANISPVLQTLQKNGVRTVMFSTAGKAAAEYIAARAGFSKTVAELAAEHQKELAEAFCRAGEFIAVLRHTAAGAVQADLYSPAGTLAGALTLPDGKTNSLPLAIALSQKLRKVRRQNRRIALWLGGAWLAAASFGWQLAFKTVLPGAALALMLVISALAVWLNSRRLLKN